MKKLHLFDDENISRIPFSGCWIWEGAITKLGYGKKRDGINYKPTHRLSWIQKNGQIPNGKCVLHICDVRCCINPDHLFLGSQADNIKDMIQKGRNKNGGNFKTHKNGSNHYKSVLNKLIAKEILSSNLSKLDLSKIYGVSESVISRIRNGTHWTVRK